jgi:hypothetical protein
MTATYTFDVFSSLDCFGDDARGTPRLARRDRRAR